MSFCLSKLRIVKIMKHKLCIDMCCGLKGFSKAFLDDGWEVITIDNEIKFNPTICKDIRKVTVGEIYREASILMSEYDQIVILASPPCERFSIAPHVWPLPGVGRSLEIVGAILELIIAIKPNYWCLENPGNGLLRWFIGKPAIRIRLNVFGYKTVKPTGLWGNIPIGLINDSPKKNKDKDTFANFASKRPDIRAKLPRGLSQTLLESIK